MGRRRWFAGLIASIALIATACGGEPVELDPIEEVDPQTDPDPVAPPEADPEPEPDPEPAPEVEPDEEPPAPAPGDDDQEIAPGSDDDPDQVADDEPGTDDEIDVEVASEPDPERLADPCGEHPDGEMTSFIDLVSPVDGQAVSGDIQLVGCANVHEANVEWQVIDADGAILTEGFTTADCAMTCNGVFDDVVTLESAEPGTSVTVEVFSSNMADDGPDRLQEVVVTVNVE